MRDGDHWLYCSGVESISTIKSSLKNYKNVFKIMSLSKTQDGEHWLYCTGVVAIIIHVL